MLILLKFLAAAASLAVPGWNSDNVVPVSRTVYSQNAASLSSSDLCYPEHVLID